ncbi:MFS transporter [Salipaludibacillus sp. CF4.18]|uniref:MFS transporter n=1 Tax=Salipaludibacillus sp. CF4.18 TaxID=3373081 RepID=UPI003EE6E310
MDKLLLKLAILSVSVLTIMAGAAVSPALGEIALAFPDSNETTIKLLLTLPSIMIIPFIFISSSLTKRFSKKSVLLVGMVFYLIGGVGGGLVSSIETLLLFRAILGIGVGLMMPISTSIVSDFFDGKERTAMMGQLSAATNLGGVVLFVLSGFLVSYSWRMTFSVYLLALVSMVIVYFFLPKKEDNFTPSQIPTSRLPKIIYLYGLGMFLTMMVFFSIPSNIALFMVQEDIGNPQLAGVVISSGTASGFVSGLILGYVYQWLKTYFIPMQVLLFAIGFFVVSLSTNSLTMGVGVAIAGFGMGSIIPTVFDQVSREVPKSQTVQAMAIVTSMLFLGQFLSPIVFDFVGVLFGNPTIRFTYQVLTISLIFACLGFFINSFKRYKRYKSHMAKERKTSSMNHNHLG